MKAAAAFLGVVDRVLLTIAMLFTAGWVRPPILGTQAGFRGLAMDQLTTPAASAKLKLANALPDAIPTGVAGRAEGDRGLQERPGSEGPHGRPVQHADGGDHDLGRAASRAAPTATTSTTWPTTASTRRRSRAG